MALRINGQLSLAAFVVCGIGWLLGTTALLWRQHREGALWENANTSSTSSSFEPEAPEAPERHTEPNDEPPLPLLCLFIVRHGERADDVARADGAAAEWKKTAERPHDPPLTERGRKQARATGEAIWRLLTTNESLVIPPHDPSSLGDCGMFLANRVHGGEAPPADDPTVVIWSSPFLRCVQTSAEIAQAIAERLGRGGVGLRLEHGITEYYAKSYYRAPGPELLPDDILFVSNNTNLGIPAPGVRKKVQLAHRVLAPSEASLEGGRRRFIVDC